MIRFAHVLIELQRALLREDGSTFRTLLRMTGAKVVAADHAEGWPALTERFSNDPTHLNSKLVDVPEIKGSRNHAAYR